MVNVTRAYTNPVNAIQSIAFCCPITLNNAQTGLPQSAVLLRVVPVSSFEKKWVFPTDEYKAAEISLIDSAGDYIIKGHSFKNSNFYEFYQSYNSATPAMLENMKNSMSGEPGILEITNSMKQRCLIAHARVNSTDDWTIVTMIPAAELDHLDINWTLAGIIAAIAICYMFFAS